MPTRKPWWLQNDEQARKNRPESRKAPATTPPVPPGGIAVAYPGPRPPVYQLPDPPDSCGPIHKRAVKKPGKRRSQVSDVKRIDDLIDGGMQKTEARQLVADQTGTPLTTITQMHLRKGRNVNRRPKKPDAGPTKNQKQSKGANRIRQK